MTTPTTTPSPGTVPGPGELLAAALGYAARGWRVIPLAPGTKRPAFPDHTAEHCTGTDPRCRAAGTHLGWEARATTDIDRITRAWTRPTAHGHFRRSPGSRCPARWHSHAPHPSAPQPQACA